MCSGRGIFKRVCSARGGCEIGVCSGNDAVRTCVPGGVSVRTCEKVCSENGSVKTCVPGGISVSTCVRGGVRVRKCVRGGVVVIVLIRK